MQMPTNVFANTNTSVSVLFIDKSRDNNKVMFVDASKMGRSIKVGKYHAVLSSTMKKIIEAIINRESIQVSVDYIRDAAMKNDKAGFIF